MGKPILLLAHDSMHAHKLLTTGLLLSCLNLIGMGAERESSADGNELSPLHFDNEILDVIIDYLNEVSIDQTQEVASK